MARRNAAAGVTVGQVVRKLGIENAAEVAWSVGRAAADFWKSQHDGLAPPVALVPKTSGAGTHHMAVYPRSFRPTLLRLARLCASAQRAAKKAPRKAPARRVRQPDLVSGKARW
jgi:hypothetical protein